MMPSNSKSSDRKIPRGRAVILVTMTAALVGSPYVAYLAQSPGPSEAIAVSLLTLLIAAAVLWLSSALLRSRSGSLERIGRTLAEFRDGDATARTGMSPHDEIGTLGHQLDALLDDIRATHERDVAQQNAINESVIGLLKAVARLAQRDLTVHVPVAEDVTGALADALNSMTEETAAVLAKVIAVSNDVALSAQEVSAQSSTVMTVATEERGIVLQSAEQLEEASQSMLQIADLATRCNSAARSAGTTAETAQGSVLGAVDGIKSLREVIREAEKRIKRLGERSQEISSVVSLINSIAERTHILALNAAMHAAAAGEAGRGFAVVANEVQRLAENAREATSKVTLLVGGIQSETSEAVLTMNTAITTLVHEIELAERAGTQMRETHGATLELVSLVQQIATESETQVRNTRIIKDRAAEIMHSTTRTCQELQNQVGHTQLLLEYSGALLEAVNIYKLPKRADTARPESDLERTVKIRVAANG